MFLIFHLLRPNVLPLDDIGMLRGISENYFSGESVSRSEAKEVAAAWAPYRSVAVWYLWRSLDPLPVEYRSMNLHDWSPGCTMLRLKLGSVQCSDTLQQHIYS
jgi:hypothetical protein